MKQEQPKENRENENSPESEIKEVPVTEPEEKVELQMAPMIDVIFQLIIFFMCASTFLPTERQLKVNMPTSPMEVTSQQIDIPDEVNIVIKGDGTVMVNNRPYDSPDSRQLPALSDMLAKLKKAFPKQAVYIDPEKGVLHGRVVDVLNACAASQIENISFRAPAS